VSAALNPERLAGCWLAGDDLSASQ
jgi:hypothetical protein